MNRKQQKEIARQDEKIKEEAFDCLKKLNPCSGKFVFLKYLSIV